MLPFVDTRASAPNPALQCCKTTSNDFLGSCWANPIPGGNNCGVGWSFFSKTGTYVGENNALTSWSVLVLFMFIFLFCPVF